MLFNSPIFLFAYLPFILFGYFVLPVKVRNLFLLIASIIFYWWGEPIFIRVIILMIVVNYLFALLISIFSKSRQLSQLLLFAGCGANLIFLFVYKYNNFFLENLFYIFPKIRFNLSEAILPLAISFFTFHAISYLVDVYRKKILPQKSLLQLSLYFLFFPHLLAGPIVRYADISDQLIKRRITTESFVYGIRRFITGLSKKVLIADTLAFPIDEIFSTPPSHLMPTSAWLGILGYTLQIYFDFSGYSDMAIGLASMFGFKFPENFNYPYASKSVTEFWKRWHITLSNWFRDYVYIPLGGNRVARFRTYINLWVVFLLVGLWHGAGWNFIFWGIYQGFFLVLERIELEKKTFDRIFLPRIFSHLYLILVTMIGWVFFRSKDFSYAISFIRQLSQVFESKAYQNAYHPLAYFARRDVLLALIIGSILSFPIIKTPSEKLIKNSFTQIIALLFLFFIFLLSLVAVSVQTYNPFIYFRF